MIFLAALRRPKQCLQCSSSFEAIVGRHHMGRASSGRGRGRKTGRGRGQSKPAKGKAKARPGAKRKSEDDTVTSDKCDVQATADVASSIFEGDSPSEAGPSPHSSTFISPLHDFPIFEIPVPKLLRARVGSQESKPDASSKRDPAKYLAHITRAMFDRLTKQEQAAGAAFFERFGAASLASICAGTDSARLVLEELVDLFSDKFPDVSVVFRHAFSSELDPKKREFLIDMFSMSSDPDGQLFGDVCTLSSGDAVPNYAKNSEKVEPNDFNILVGGFPCKDVSSRNPNRRRNRENVAKRRGKTGSCFSGIIELQKTKQASEQLFSIYENVLGLAVPAEGLDVHSSNLAATLALLRDECKQFAFALQLDPRLFGCPASRGRFWMPGLTEFAMNTCGLSASEAYSWITHLVRRFSGHDLLLDISDILLPSDNLFVSKHFNNLKKRPLPWESDLVAPADSGPSSSSTSTRGRRRGKGNGGRGGGRGGALWPMQHEAFSQKSGQWWTAADLDKIAVGHVGIRELTERCFDLLVVRGVPFPDKFRRLVETSQIVGRSNPKLHEQSDTHFPCITPKMKLWISDLCRCVIGVEALHAQGIDYGLRQHQLLSYDSEFLSDLAGNAFQTGCLGAVALAIITSLGIALKRKAGQKIHEIRSGPLFQDAAILDEEASDADIDELWS